MKLFIWAKPYQVSYGSSLLIVVAESVDEARAQASTGKRYSFGEFEQGSSSTAWAELIKDKEPTRVVELPCAEWHEWSE